MSEFSRRDAVKAVAVAAGVVAAVGGAATADDKPAKDDKKVSPPSKGVIEKSGKVAKGPAGVAAEVKAERTARKASVLHCRSWDNHVYLYMDEGVKGFVPVNDLGFAIAAACSAAGRQVTVTYWGYDPNWGDGVGHFEGVNLSIE